MYMCICDKWILLLLLFLFFLLLLLLSSSSSSSSCIVILSVLSLSCLFLFVLCLPLWRINFTQKEDEGNVRTGKCPGVRKVRGVRTSLVNRCAFGSRVSRVVAADLLYVDVALWLDQQFSGGVAVCHRRQTGDVLKYRLIFHFHLCHSSTPHVITRLRKAGHSRRAIHYVCKRSNDIYSPDNTGIQWRFSYNS